MANTVHTVTQLIFLISCICPILQAAVFSNKIMGKPTVSCGPDSIQITSDTEKEFEGVVYVKHWRRKRGCSRSFSAGKSMQPSYSLRLNQLATCGIEMRRRPSDGTVEMLGVFVFSFHPTFVTSGDKAYAVHCIFKQYEATVATGFPLKELITKDTLVGVGRLPDVHMDVMRGESNSPAKTVRVGEALVFKWTLPSTSDVYGLRVRDCTAETLQGQRVLVMEDGCSLDQTAISHISYSEDLSEAHANAAAFKFADADDMWFKCTVTVCNKFTSVGYSEDSCTNIKKCSGRGRRELTAIRLDEGVKRTVDDKLLETRVLVLDSYNQHVVTQSGLNKTSRASQIRHPPVSSPWRVCMRKPIFALVASLIMLMYGFIIVAGGLMLLILCARKRFGHSDADPSESTCSSIDADAASDVWTTNF